MKKNILFVMTGMPVGGAEKFVISLANSLIIDLFNLTIISLSNINPLAQELNKNIDFIAIPRKGKFDTQPLLSLRKIINEVKFDKIICVGPFPFFFTCVATLFNYQPKIISYHTTIPLNKKTDILYRLYFSFLRKKDQIITVSKNQAKYTANRYKIPTEVFTTIYNGIDISHWKLAPNTFSKQALREEYGLPANSKVIILTASLRPEKNHEGAIRSLSILHNKYNFKAYLLIVGGGLMLTNLEALAAELGLEEYVKFAGHQTDVRPFYWISDLFTLCSQRVETFSIAALEAMACGLPGVLTNIGGANEMIVEGTNGLLCIATEDDISDKWYKAFNTAFNAEAISANVHQNYGHINMAKEYENIFI
jgi:glycosyltransferase involved in cell wall biosynthesis